MMVCKLMSSGRIFDVLWSRVCAGVAELVDAADSKSAARMGVGVRFPLPALRGRLMVGQRVLVPHIGVRIPAPQLVLHRATR